jgi:hypothetical protein
MKFQEFTFNILRTLLIILGLTIRLEWVKIIFTIIYHIINILYSHILDPNVILSLFIQIIGTFF